MRNRKSPRMARWPGGVGPLREAVDLTETANGGRDEPVAHRASHKVRGGTQAEQNPLVHAGIDGDAISSVAELLIRMSALIP